ncbi:hypothetical protein [uncultured Clostridium sp.]|uniref:hypothetical protein n=1 Tax=uncultured Clostridium sp. TaxID=59620 RepID=UPI00260A5228|nr:hypothetical protein [uncultured Clostridium sp.]
MIKKDILTLKDTDIYSLSMFALYKLIDVPEYSAISELPYILDRFNMLKLCEYFGGRTIKIPTTDELYSIMTLLLLYQYVNIEGKSYDEAIKLIGYESKDLRKVKSIYNKLCKILDNYDIKARSKYDEQ